MLRHCLESLSQRVLDFLYESAPPLWGWLRARKLAALLSRVGCPECNARTFRTESRPSCNFKDGLAVYHAACNSCGSAVSTHAKSIGTAVRNIYYAIQTGVAVHGKAEENMDKHLEWVDETEDQHVWVDDAWYTALWDAKHRLSNELRECPGCHRQEGEVYAELGSNDLIRFTYRCDACCLRVSVYRPWDYIPSKSLEDTEVALRERFMTYFSKRLVTRLRT